MKRLFLLLALACAGCESDEDRTAKFTALCVCSDFSARQCALLNAMRAGVAIGFSAGAIGGRR